MTKPGSSHALQLLRDTIAGFDGGTRQRGRDYYKDNAILELYLDDDIVTASVQGSEVYTTTLLWEDDEWSCECSCSVEFNCKHAYAVALAWIDQCEGKLLRPIPVAKTVTAATTASYKDRKLTFREEWTPILEKKIGHALTAEEEEMLGQLSALFNELRNKGGSVSAYSVHRHGFAATNEAPGSDFWKPAYDGWWSYNNPPADPWALWQFIAYDWERHGRTLPEAFRAMTDTGKVRAALDARLTENELGHWRSALASQAVPAVPPSPDDVLGEHPDLRLRIDTKGIAVLETRLKPDKPWKAAARKWLAALASCSLETIQRLPENARILALTLRLNGGHGLVHYAAGALPAAVLESVLANPATHTAVVLSGDSPFHIEEAPLELIAQPDPSAPTQLALSIVLPNQIAIDNDARPFCLRPVPLYLVENRIGLAFASGPVARSVRPNGS